VGSVPGPQTGVIYNNEFIDNWYPGLGYGVSINGDPSSWNTPLALGTSNAVFIEDNDFSLQRQCATSSNGASCGARQHGERRLPRRAVLQRAGEDLELPARQ
jgi:hypothetical protein